MSNNRNKGNNHVEIHDLIDDAVNNALVRRLSNEETQSITGGKHLVKPIIVKPIIVGKIAYPYPYPIELPIKQPPIIGVDAGGIINVGQFILPTA